MFQPVFAYLDPGSGSLILQVLFGGFAGIAAFVKYRWDRIRAKGAVPFESDADGDG